MWQLLVFGVRCQPGVQEHGEPSLSLVIDPLETLMTAQGQPAEGIGALCCSAVQSSGLPLAVNLREERVLHRNAVTATAHGVRRGCPLIQTAS